MKLYGNYNMIPEMPENKQEQEKIIFDHAKRLMKIYENYDWKTLSIIVKKPNQILNPFDMIKEPGELLPFWTVGIKVEIDEERYKEENLPDHQEER